jgi:hypothetical protein
VCIHTGVFLSYEEWNYVVSMKMDGTGDHYFNWNKLVLQRKISHVFSHMESMNKDKEEHEGKRGTTREE